MTHEPITFRIKNENQKFILKWIGIDDMGYIMRPPIGENVDNSLFGKTVIAPDGVEYKVKSIAMRQNILWLAINEH
jgi:hypothetical protein